MVSIEEARRLVADLRSEVDSLKMDYHTIREVETLLNRTLLAIERATGSKEIAQAVNTLQRFMTIVRQAQMTINLFYVASGPIGWAMLGVSMATTAISMGTLLGDMQYNLSRGY